MIIDYGGVLSIVPVLQDPVKAGRGLLKDLPGLSEEVIEEHRVERNREGR